MVIPPTETTELGNSKAIINEKNNYQASLGFYWGVYFNTKKKEIGGSNVGVVARKVKLCKMIVQYVEENLVGKILQNKNREGIVAAAPVVVLT